MITENTNFLNNGETPPAKEVTKKPRVKKEVPLPVQNVKAEIVQPDKIEAELIKVNVTNEAIAAMREFMNLTIDGINDKEGLKAVYEARIMVKNTRVLTVRVCEKGREALIVEQKAWVAKEKELTGQMKEIEANLQAKEDVVENEKQRIRSEKEAAEQERLHKRIALLTSKQMKFDGVHYTLRNVSITSVQVKIMDEFSFQLFTEELEVAYQEEVKVLAEKRELELQEREKQEAIKAENARKEQELKDREEAIKREQERIQKEAQEREAKNKTERDAFEAEKKAHADKILKEEQEKQRTIELEVAKKKAAEDAIVAEQVRIKKAEEDRIAAEQKAIADKLEHDRLVEIEVKRQEALKPDREKIAVLSAKVSLIEFPEMTTEAGKVAMVEIKLQMGKMVAYLNKKVESIG